MRMIHSPPDILWRLAPLTLVLLLSACATQLLSEPAPGGEFLQRKAADYFQFRMMSWNVRVSLMFDEPERRLDDLARLTRAVQPDIIVLQEAMVPGMDETLPETMNREAPPAPGQEWHFHYASDNVVLSRFPLLGAWAEEVVPYSFSRSPDFHYGQALILADLPDDRSARDIFVVAMHNKSGTGELNVRLQQLQSDSIVSTVRKRLQQDSPRALPPGTPIIIAGDMNVIAAEPALHFHTLVTGDIADEETWGPDYPLDWDGTDLADARPSHNSRGVHHYTMAHGFVLNTTLLSDAVLEDLELNWFDSLWNHQRGQYDHLPVIVDFVIDAP